MRGKVKSKYVVGDIDYAQPKEKEKRSNVPLKLVVTLFIVLTLLIIGQAPLGITLPISLGVILVGVKAIMEKQ